MILPISIVWISHTTAARALLEFCKLIVSVNNQFSLLADHCDDMWTHWSAMLAGQAIAMHNKVFPETYSTYFVCRMRVADFSYFKD